MTPNEVSHEMRAIGAEPIWVSVSATHVGISEIPGRMSAPVILRWAEDLGVAKIYTNDDVAWCALYMNRVLQACQLPVAGQSYELLRALMFADYGQKLASDAYGMIGVFNRPGGAHVGLILGQSADRYLVRGGNQSNAVGHVFIEKSRLVARRWPFGVSLPTVGLKDITSMAPTTVNER